MTRVRNYRNTTRGNSISSPFTNALNFHHQVCPPGTQFSTIPVRIQQWPSCHHFWSLAFILFYLSLEMPPLTRESIPPCSFPSLTHPVPSPPVPGISVLQGTPSPSSRLLKPHPFLQIQSPPSSACHCTHTAKWWHGWGKQPCSLMPSSYSRAHRTVFTSRSTTGNPAVGAIIIRVCCTSLKSQYSSVVKNEPLGMTSSICRFKSHFCPRPGWVT